MAFYVPLGSRGVLFRIGTTLIGVWGSLVYWQASRRRTFRPPTLAVAPVLADVPPVI